MAAETLEERMAAMEQELARIKQQLQAQTVPPSLPWWEKIAGTFATSEHYDEAMRLGREYQASLRPIQHTVEEHAKDCATLKGKDSTMPQTRTNSHEIGERGELLYQQSIRAEVETPDNIGKMVIIDVATGDYAVDDNGLKAARHLHAKRPDAELYGVRIGYKAAEALGGVLERVGS